MANKNKSKFDISKLKNFKLTRKAQIILRVIVIVVLFLFLFLAAAERLNIASITDINDGIRNFFAGLSAGDGYPYEINSSSVEDITVLNGDLFILKDDETISLDSTAKEVKKTSHTYSNPTMAIRGGKAVVYDRNGNRYRVENRTDTLYTGETEDDEKIITAAMSAKGQLALATFSDNAGSKLTVYSSNYKKVIFSWTCMQDRIIAVDLSDNGKYAAVAVVGARDGEIYSKVVIFDYDYAEPKAEFEYSGTALLGIKFVKDDNVVAVGDNKITFIKNLKTNEDVDYGSSTLSNFAFSEDGYTVLVLSEHGSTNNELLTCYSSSFNDKFTEKFDSTVKSLYVDNGRISVLLEDMVYVYKVSGGVYRKYETDSTAISVFNLGSRTYLYSIGKISQCGRK